MPAIRFRSRHLHATLVKYVRIHLDTQGWITAPVNFDTQPCTVIDYQPEERNTLVQNNTVAVTLGDFSTDEDEEMGALGGGLRSAPYVVFVDVYMAEQALSVAICDDIRDMFLDLHLPLVNQLTGLAVPGTDIDIEFVDGPEKPPAAVGAEQFKKYWRIMRLHARLYYSS